MEVSRVWCRSPIGDIYCLFDGSDLIALSIQDITACSGKTTENRKAAPFSRLYNELDAYFKARLREFSLPIKFTMGTDFEQGVWLVLREIPYGETRSYKWIAEKVGRTGAARAVGQALSKNPLPIILPCHRVIASDGSIGGFSCGVEIKKWLLRHEALNSRFKH